MDQKRRRLGKNARIAFPSANRRITKNFTDGRFCWGVGGTSVPLSPQQLVEPADYTVYIGGSSTATNVLTLSPRGNSRSLCQPCGRHDMSRRSGGLLLRLGFGFDHDILITQERWPSCGIILSCLKTDGCYEVAAHCPRQRPGPSERPPPVP